MQIVQNELLALIIDYNHANLGPNKNQISIRTNDLIKDQ